MLPCWAWAIVFLALAVFWPPICEPFFDLDLLDASINSLGYIIMALGLNIVVGFAGLLDLGYVAFYAIGAFVMGWLGSAHFADADDPHRRRRRSPTGCRASTSSSSLILIAGALFTALWGVILGAPTLRLRGDYLAIVTLAFGEIVPRVFENSTSGIFGIGHTDFSNGRQGITPVDKVALLPGADPLKYPLDLNPIYYVALVMVLFVLFFNFRLRDSRLGRAWIAVREDEVAAAAMGVNLVADEALGLRDRRGARRLRRRVPRRPTTNTVNVDQFEFGFSVFILVHGHHRRHGQHLGRGPRRRRAVDDQPLPAATSSTASPTRSAWTSTSRRSTSGSSASCSS